ncbi:MAG TPA: enolase C-terminal domain-like protein [Rubrobacteraceae bacterium]|jgi:L-alanine-DL-glutamate epimerase-like enolase superfamily enzyme|nr:enolase C-terminal domain-like protein [Rubrobacteraceae bacterium]
MSETTATGVAVERLEVSAYTVPTDSPESDGTLEWDSTAMILVEASGGGKKGLGYTYGDVSVGKFIESKLVSEVEGKDTLSPPRAWAAMQGAIRNAGRPGVGAMAVSAVDNALWDLKARLLEVPLAAVLPRFHAAVPIYGSGGFTSYSIERLQEQLSGWAAEGIPRVKMKVGRHPDQDPHRVSAVREAIGDDVELLVDANGAYSRKQALYWAERFADDGITYLEEPVTSEDREGLRLLRDHGPGGLAIAAGEYEWTLPQIAGLADCVDILQADVTRCGGITNLLRVDGICKGRTIPFSAHCAPQISAHACCAMETLVHLEYFHDHSRIEGMLFDGALSPEGGQLRPDPSRPGLGLELKRSEAEQYAV